MNTSNKAKVISVLLLMAAIILPSLATPAYAKLTGAIWTTDVSGNKVNGNIYENKCDVYLNGGPGNGNNNVLPDGAYYFQVTDPSGAMRLTGLTEDLPRAVTVTDGVFTLVQLCPFDDTPNPGGVYKVWVTPQAAYDTTRTKGTFGFIESDCKTDNFVIRPKDVPLPQYLTVRKFQDSDADGVWGPEEEAIEGWLVEIQPEGGSPTQYHTPVQITVSEGCWDVTELIPDGWMQTAVYVDGVSGTVAPDVSVCFTNKPGETREVVFGNIPLGSISGAKFKDCDADGVRDDGEQGIEGWLIHLTGTDVKNNAVSKDTKTGPDGAFTFPDLLPGDYTVTEDTSDAKWLATTATSFTHTLLVGEQFIGPDFGNVPLGTITACKFYDLDFSKTNNGEQPVNGIRFVLTRTDVEGTPVTACTVDGCVTFAGLLPGTYTLAEVLPPNWLATTLATIEGIVVTCDGPSKQDFEFGDVCLEPGHGGLTLGYWSNRNGQALITAGDVTALNSLNLFKPASLAYPFSATLSTAKTQIKSYLLSATAVDMRWMLSAQLIATELDVLHGFLGGSTVVYVGPSSYVPSGFITIAQIMANAATALGKPHPDFRTEQEYWKNLLDGVNNNRLPFVCAVPCPVVYP